MSTVFVVMLGAKLLIGGGVITVLSESAKRFVKGDIKLKRSKGGVGDEIKSQRKAIRSSSELL